jgi:class 3 adenylate cyclase
VIGLFGPPFYEADESGRIIQAIDAALAIRAMTETLGEELKIDGGLAITAGVHFGPLLVGSFAPNDNFTGFSSGMNNTARLQGQGERNEVLVMKDTIEKLVNGPFKFADEREARVKNVDQPLVFRPCLGR